MKHLTFSDGTEFQVSVDIYCTQISTVHSKGPALWRLVGDVYSNTPQLGGHWNYDEGWRTVINLSNCYNGVERWQGCKSIIVGIHKNELNLFETHPLNKHYENHQT